jgi:hypothetical protein
MSRWLVVLIAAVSSDTALAELNLSFAAGTRDETDSEDRLPAVAAAVDFGHDRWRIRPEFGLTIGFDPLYGGDETELSIGAVSYWKAETSWIHFGAGLSSVSSDWGANSGSSTGAYLHAGATWPLKARRIGFDVRYLNADDFTAWGTAFPVGYVQIALFFVW